MIIAVSDTEAALTVYYTLLESSLKCGLTVWGSISVGWLEGGRGMCIYIYIVSLEVRYIVDWTIVKAARNSSRCWKFQLFLHSITWRYHVCRRRRPYLCKIQWLLTLHSFIKVKILRYIFPITLVWCNFHYCCSSTGTIFGMANTLSSFGGWLSAYMVGVLTYQNVSNFNFMGAILSLNLSIKVSPLICITFENIFYREETIQINVR